MVLAIVGQEEQLGPGGLGLCCTAPRREVARGRKRTVVGKKQGEERGKEGRREGE